MSSKDIHDLILKMHIVLPVGITTQFKVICCLIRCHFFQKLLNLIGQRVIEDHGVESCTPRLQLKTLFRFITTSSCGSS